MAVWLVVAIGIRLVGHNLLDPSTPLIVGGFFVAVVPLMAIVTYPVYLWLEIPRARRPGAAAVMALPGMVLDVLVVGAAEVILPQFPAQAIPLLGAIFLFGYAVVLCTGFVPGARSH